MDSRNNSEERDSIIARLTAERDAALARNRADSLVCNELRVKLAKAESLIVLRNSQLARAESRAALAEFDA